MFETTRSGTNIVSNHRERALYSALAGLLVIALSACQNAAAPNLPPTPTTIAIVTLDVLLKPGVAPPDGQVITAGYLIVDQAGAALVDGLSFAADGTPQRITNSDQIWLGARIETNLKAQLRAAGEFLFAPVRVRGTLEGASAYGPGGSYQYQIIRPSIDVITAQETSISDLLDHSAGYENRLVRLVGGMIARDSSALLVDQLGPGGLPLPKARQIKLRGPIQDRALLGRLKGVSGGAIRFGQVQVEGFWHAGVLTPLSIILVTNA